MYGVWIGRVWRKRSVAWGLCGDDAEQRPDDRHRFEASGVNIEAAGINSQGGGRWFGQATWFSSERSIGWQARRMVQCHGADIARGEGLGEVAAAAAVEERTRIRMPTRRGLQAGVDMTGQWTMGHGQWTVVAGSAGGVPRAAGESSRRASWSESVSGCHHPEERS